MFCHINIRVWRCTLFSNDSVLHKFYYLQVLKPDEPTAEGYYAESVQTVKQR